MQWDEKELDTKFTPNVYIWTPNSESWDFEGMHPCTNMIFSYKSLIFF